MTGTLPRPAIARKASPVAPARGTAAGIVSRTAANVIDFVLTATLLAATYVGYTTFRFLLHPRKFTFPAPSLFFVIVSGTIVAGVYFAVSWATTGRTYGDLTFGLRVVSRTGAHPRPLAAILRAAVSVLVPIGLFWSGVDRNRRSLQDIIVRTSVVYDWPDAAPAVTPRSGGTT
jgi:uncharacterized RDD family membrane protein YckC